jgi:hypothetical protein
VCLFCSMKFDERRPIAAEVFHVDVQAQTDMTKLIVAFFATLRTRLKIRHVLSAINDLRRS